MSGWGGSKPSGIDARMDRAEDFGKRGRTPFPKTVCVPFSISYSFPGMQVNAEIHSGTRSVLEYLLSTIQKVAHEAGRER